MRRAREAAFTIVVLAALVYALLQDGPLAWHLLAFVVLVTILVMASQAAPLAHIQVGRTTSSGPHYANQSLDVTLTVTAGSRWIWPHVMVIDHLPAVWGVSEPRFVLHRLGRATEPLSYQIPALKRGFYALDNVSLVTSDLFGFFPRTRQISAPISLVVWPAVVPLPPLNLLAHATRGQTTAARSSASGTAYLRGIREYIPGDRLSHVHWKTSARTGEFKVKQFEPETTPQFTIVLDTAHRFTPDGWELAVSIAASLLEAAQQHDQSLSLMALDKPGASFQAGPGRLASMMDFLAALPHAAGAVPTPPSWSETQLVVVTTVDHQAAWRGAAGLVLGVGSGGIERLDDLPAVVSPRGFETGGTP